MVCTYIKVFRVLRLGRVLRVFKVFKGFQKLVAAISASIIPVLNAFLMLLIIVSVYAVLGTYFFRKRSPEYFGQFSVSLYTMFQILAEGIAISREIFQEGKTETSVAFYFVSFILIVSVGLLNVVVAVLLEAFQKNIRVQRQKMEETILIEEKLRKVKGCLDPLTKGLLTFEDEADLTSRIDEIYSKLDEDESEGLAFEEFRDGVKWLSENIHLTRDDFDVVTENGKHLGPTAEFNRQQFQTMMKGELWRYSRRELANVLSVSGDEQFNSTILMLKIMESSNDTALAEVLRLLRSISEHIQLPAGPSPPGLQQLAQPAPPDSPNGRASLGTEGARGGFGGGVEGLGEVLHKLSSNMERMSSQMEQISATVDRQSSNMEQMSAKINWQSVVLEDQRAMLQDQKAEIKRLSHARPRDEAKMQGTGQGEESTSLQQVENEYASCTYPTAPGGHALRDPKRWQSTNDLMMRQSYAEAHLTYTRLTAQRESSSTSLQQVENEYASRTDERTQRLGSLLSDRVFPNPRVPTRRHSFASPNHSSSVHSENSTGALQGRRGRNGDRMEGGDFLSDPGPSTEDMEHAASDEYMPEKQTYQHLTYEDFKVRR